MKFNGDSARPNVSMHRCWAAFFDGERKECTGSLVKMSTQLERDIAITRVCVSLRRRDDARGLLFSIVCRLNYQTTTTKLIVFFFFFLLLRRPAPNQRTVAEIYASNWRRSASVFQLAVVKHRQPRCSPLSSKVTITNSSKRHFLVI